MSLALLLFWFSHYLTRRWALARRICIFIYIYIYISEVRGCESVVKATAANGYEATAANGCKATAANGCSHGGSWLRSHGGSWLRRQAAKCMIYIYIYIIIFFYSTPHHHHHHPPTHVKTIDPQQPKRTNETKREHDK